jgi:hypothetical protein
MKITNRKLLKQMRTPGYCELCGFFMAKRQPHHLWHRTPEITIRINTISLGAMITLPDGRERFLCRCHRMIHDGGIPANRVLSIVALREKCQPEEIIEVMNLFRRLVKPTPRQLEVGLQELSVGARLIAMREIEGTNT